MALADRDKFEIIAEHFCLFPRTLPKSLLVWEGVYLMVYQVRDTRWCRTYATVDTKVGERAKNWVGRVADAFCFSFDAFTCAGGDAWMMSEGEGDCGEVYASGSGYVFDGHPGLAFGGGHRRLGWR